MVVAALACLAGLAAVLIALYADQPPAPAAPVAGAGWDGLPSAADVARADFPSAYPGYQPAAVERHLAAVADAYGDLLAAAPREVVERARRRAADRAAPPPPDEQPPDEQPSDEPPADEPARPSHGVGILGSDAEPGGTSR